MADDGPMSQKELHDELGEEGYKTLNIGKKQLSADEVRDLILRKEQKAIETKKTEGVALSLEELRELSETETVLTEYADRISAEVAAVVRTWERKTSLGTDGS